MATEHCKYEAKWGETQQMIKSLFKITASLRSDVDELKKMGLVITELNTNFNHLLNEVKTSNENFSEALNKLCTRVSTVEREEGDFLKALKRNYTSDVIKMILAAGTGVLLGQAFLGG